MKREFSSASSLSRLLYQATFLFMIMPSVLLSATMLPNSVLATTGSPSTPSTISQGADFTTQAALQVPRTFQSTDIVSSVGIYEVSFTTSTAGAIDKIDIVFPADTNIGAASVIEKVGIGNGVLTKVGTTLTYDVTAPVSISANSFIRLEISGIKNPTLPSNSLTASITTRDSGGTTIDGPSVTNVYKMKRIGTNDLAVSSVTSQKIAGSFMKKVILSDNPAGNTRGWNPDGVNTIFGISDTAIPQFGAITSFISIFVSDSIGATPENHFCDVVRLTPSAQTFTIACSSAPNELDELHYVIENLPPEIP